MVSDHWSVLGDFFLLLKNLLLNFHNLFLLKKGDSLMGYVIETNINWSQLDIGVVYMRYNTRCTLYIVQCNLHSSVCLAHIIYYAISLNVDRVFF